MRAVKPLQMNMIDKISIEDFGIPGIVLMENAALKVTEEACRLLGQLSGNKIAIFAGKGNNGGDAFAVARHLFQKQALVKVYLLCRPEDIKGDALVNYNILSKLGIYVEVLEEDLEKLEGHSPLSAMEQELPSCNLVIDGLYGTGFKGEISGMAAKVTNMINGSGCRILSIDIPSGVDGETGKVSPSCIRAYVTVTFGLPKVGMLIHPGCEYTGNLKIADIGLPEKAVEKVTGNITVKITDKVTGKATGKVTEKYTGNGVENLVEEPGSSIWLNDSCEIKALMPQRKTNSNKGSFGKALFVAGSLGMTGAGCLAAGGCLRCGTGLVYLAGPASIIPLFGARLAEAVCIPLADKDKGVLSEDCVEALLEKMQAVDSLAIGPGLSVNSDIINIVDEVIKSAEIPIVLDADALNALSRNIDILKRLKTQSVITPHPGEMARLLGVSIADVQNDRINAATEFSRRWKVTVVLKGSRTLIAAPDGRLFINGTGNTGLSTAGTGDVLTGIIAGFLAQGLDAVDAARAGVYIHGLAGDLAAKDRGEHGVIAGDVVEAISFAIKNLLNGTVNDFFEGI